MCVFYTPITIFTQTEADHQNLLSWDIDAEKVQSLQLLTTKTITHSQSLHSQFQVHNEQH